MTNRKIIYDVGANNGDDIPYYLLKGDLVVAIEANPVLCDQIGRRFAQEVEQGRLVIEACVVTNSASQGEIDFYLHKTNHVLSQLSPPSAEELDNFTCRTLPSKSILEIISEHGAPHYIKIDLEHYDAILLKAIFEGGIRPPFISAESHSLEIFSIFVELGGYTAFKLVDGATVSKTYVERVIHTESAPEDHCYSFPHHSAGPFGNDIDGQWMTPNNFRRLLIYAGLGWKDIHATNIENADPAAQPKLVDHLDRLIGKYLLIDFGRRAIGSLRYRVKKLFSLS